MESLISVGIAILLEALKDKRVLAKYIAAVAKVFVAIERAYAMSPNFQKEVERQRAKV